MHSKFFTFHVFGDLGIIFILIKSTAREVPYLGIFSSSFGWWVLGNFKLTVVDLSPAIPPLDLVQV